MILKSIKLKLVLWFLLTFTIIASGFDIYLYQQQEKASFSSVDRFLKSKAHVLTGFIEVYEDGRVEFEATEKKVGFERTWTVYDIPHSGHYYHVYFEDGRPLSSSPSLGEHTLPISFEKVSKGDYFYFTSGPHDAPLRVFTQKVSINIRQKDYTFIIQVAESIKDVHSFLDSLKLLMLYTIPVTLLVSGLGGFAIVWLSLRPLKTFSEDVSNITEKNLHKRLNEEKLNIELRDLAVSFNSTLDNLESAFKQQKRLISDVSHELRTPTSVIKSCCDIHLRKERDAEDYKKALDIIINNANRMESLIERLLTLSRLEQKALPFKKGKLDLGDVIRKSKQLLQPLADQKGLLMDISSLPEALFVNGDRTSLTEVFINLIDNAIKYNRKGGMVAITAVESGEDIKVNVKDTGIGIPDSEVTNIFHSFYRVDTSRTKGDSGGAGLGLNIVKAIIEKHHGKIDVTSREGEGSTFSVSLPKKV